MPFAAQEMKNVDLAVTLAAVRLVEPLVINNSAQLVLLIVAVLVVVLVGQCWCYCASVLVAVLRCAFLGSSL